jgi:osmotically-inducible protein OsmY
MRILSPIVLISLSMLPLLTGCQSMGSSISVDVPKEESPQDQALSKSVRTRLVADRKSDLTGVTVISKSGTVYLSGTVKSLDARQQAVKIAWEVPGVQSVVNGLEVQVQ